MVTMRPARAGSIQGRLGGHHGPSQSDRYRLPPVVWIGSGDGGEGVDPAGAGDDGRRWS